MIWSQLKWFRPEENWGDPDKIDPRLLAILDAYRGEIKTPLYISRGYDPSAAEGSAHRADRNGVSYAVDVFPLGEIQLLDAFLVATRYPFSGVGVYPYWKYSRGKIIYSGGLHLDTSPHRKMPNFRSAGHWMGILRDGKQEYVGVTKWDLKNHKMI